jgi:hypothetical protein
MKGAQMAIIFERIAMPWGEEPVAVQLTAVDDWTRNEKLKADQEGKVDAGRNGDKAVDNVVRGAQIGTASAGVVVLTGAATGGGGGMLAAGGATIAGGMLAGLMLTKGKEVRLDPGAVFRIKFVKPVTLPVIQQPGASPRPIQQEDKPAGTSTTKPPLN